MNSSNSPQQNENPKEILEARFRLQLFAILRNSDSLHKLLNSNDPLCPHSSLLRLQLGRFLAAYFLNFNFAAFFVNIDKISPSSAECILPNLLLWAELDEEWQKNGIEIGRGRAIWERGQLGRMLSAECTPALGLRILLGECRILEAIFLADHFNDSRTALSLRFLADREFCLNLFADFCHQIFVGQLLGAMEMNEFGGQIGEENQNVEKFIRRQIEATLRGDILFEDKFGNGLLGEMMEKCGELMGDEFGRLFDGFEGENGEERNGRIMGQNIAKRLFPLLPRPPIYSAPMSDELPLDPESKAWTKLHRCYLSISLILGRTNRLDPLIGFFALWLAQRQEKNGKEDLNLLVQSDFFLGQNEEEIRADLEAMQTMFCIVLGMEIRERMAKMEGEGIGRGNEGEMEKCWRKLEALSRPFRRKNEQEKNGNGWIWGSLEEWAKMADKNDLDSAALFLHTLQQRNQPNGRFLPPLSALSRPKWYSVLISEGMGPSGELEMENGMEMQIPEEQKLKLNRPDHLRLRYLARHFPSVPMLPPSVQMRLAFDPDEFCVEMDSNEIKMEKSNENGQLMAVLAESKAKMPILGGLMGARGNEGEKEGEEEEMDELEELAEQIRASIRRLEKLEIEQREQEEKERRVEMEVESSSNSREKMGGNGGWSRESSSQRSKQNRTYGAFLRGRIVGKEEISEEWSSSQSTPNSSSSGGTSSRGRGGREEEEESAFESMEEENWGMEGEKEEGEEMLRREMEEIGKRLEWIRGQFGRRKNKGEMKNLEEQNEEKEKEESGNWEMDGKKWTLKMEGNDGEKAEVGEEISEIEEKKEKNEEEEKEEEVGKEKEEGGNEERESALKSPEFAGMQQNSGGELASNGKRTHRIEEREENLLNLNKEEEMKRPPIAVEPMDFRGLRSSESEGEGEEGGMALGQTKKKKRALGRKWTEIEVFPRNSPEMEKQANQKFGNKKAAQKAEEKPKRKQWKPPRLRLLPPFDGAIRTERRMGASKSGGERPLLQLRLEGLEAISGGIGTPRRTFLDMAKKEKNAQKAKNEKMGETNEGEKGGGGVYDSGIGLDQTSLGGGGGGGVMLYSTEMGAEEIEEMRKIARKL